jgi:hypothetical protein
MGQRLNIEICNSTRTLANAYYHWGAYTDSALEYTAEIIDAYHNLSGQITDELQLVVKLLEATGAGITDEEKERITHDPDFDFSGINFSSAIDRNEGLIAVTEKGMEETRSWEEGRVTINIEEANFCFDVVSYYDKDEYVEDYGVKSLSKLTQIDHNFFLDYLPFEKISWLREFVKNNPTGVIVNSCVINWIE